MITLKAEKRDLNVKPKKLRREGYVTASVFGKDIEGSVPVQISAHDVELALRSAGKGSRIVLDIDGDKKNVLIKEIQSNVLKRQILEIDFQELVAGEMVKSVAEVVLENETSVNGGIVELLMSEIHYSALPESITDKVVVDCSTLKVGSEVKVKDLALAKDKNVKLISDPEAVVVNVAHQELENEADDTASDADATDAQ